MRVGWNAHTYLLLAMLLAKLLLSGLASAWSIEKGGVAVASQGSTAERDSFSALDGPVELYEGTTLDVAFKIAGTPIPHQVSVRVSARAADAPEAAIDQIVPAKVRGNNAKAVLPFKTLPSELYNYDLDVTALLSDLSGEAQEEKLFDLVAYGHEDGQRASLFRSTGSGANLAAKPQIFHQFQSKPKHVNPVFSLTFVAGILALFAGLLSAWACLWNNTKRAQSSTIVPELARWGLIAAIEAAFLLYYWKFSIFVTIELTVPPFLLLLASSAYLQSAKA